MSTSMWAFLFVSFDVCEQFWQWKDTENDDSAEMIGSRASSLNRLARLEMGDGILI